MKNSKYQKYLLAGLTAFLVIAASLLFYYLLFHQDSVRRVVSNILHILSPLIFALIISYVISPAINLLERRVIAPFYACRQKEQSARSKKLTRGLLIVLMYQVVIFLLYILISTLIPELFSSVANITLNFSGYVSNVQLYFEKLLKNYPDLLQSADQFFSEFTTRLSNWMTNDLMPMLRDLLLNLSGQLLSMVTVFKNVLLGAIVAIYVLYHKESYIAKLKRAVYAFFGLERGNALIRDCQYINKEFSGFLVGKIIDSIIIGILCYLVTNLIGTPYALLVSVIIGVTNVIPFFGPFLGAVPCLILILLIDPLQALYFLIFVLLLQQFDGNFLGPKILGETTGVSSFLIIVSILIGGGFMGVFGMIIAVPVCAIICTFFRNLSDHLLEKNSLPTETEFYRKLDHINPETKEAIPYTKKEINEKDLFQFRRKKLSPQDVVHTILTTLDHSSAEEKSSEDTKEKNQKED
ncbi:MAG: AI-2E family transporter [Fusicatenibacter sp.]|nr:AI-2E family transporter [Lachnospiraceae bacterium]MDY2936825.1 AI-2E family transporter [Fusicatenibacter sp.]